MQQGFMAYPQAGWRRLLFRAPLYLWRMGLGFVLPSQMLVLTTTGRKSGQPRHTMVEYSYISGTFYLVSGWGEQTQWSQNLLADPYVTVQPVQGGVVTGTARRVTDADEMAALFVPMQKSPVWNDWLAAQGIEPTAADFAAKRDRVTVIAVEPGHVPAPPPLKADLQWVTWLLVAVVLAKLVGARRSPQR